jgi:phytoene dehydrogenase-like protein
MTRRRDVVVVGAGHNGLVAAAYLTRAGLDVEVVERDRIVGGAVSTVERWPGVRVDRGSSIHVMIRHTGIVEDLELAALGLRYDDVEPWGVLPHPDAPLRFSADLDETCASIAASCGDADAAAYRRFVAEWTPRMRAFLETGNHTATAWSFGRAMLPLGRAEKLSGTELTARWLEPAEALINRTFADERLRGAVAWWAAQAGPPPHEVGTAPLAGTLALLHLRKPGRPQGGSGRLSEALAERIRSGGGTIRVDDAATRIDAAGRPAVETASGDRIEARAVVAACHVVTTARLLGDPTAAARPRIGAGLGMVVRLLTDALPAYSAPVPGMHTAMQLLVDGPQQLRTAYGDFLSGRHPHRPPLVVMTPTATDPTLAPPGRHVVTAWAQWHPSRLATGRWQDRRDEVGDSILATLETWAPGVTSSVIDRVVQTPGDLEAELGLLGGNVMHVEESLDSMFMLRPMPGWSGHRAPYPGVYLCGASTHPGGGVWGASGRTVAGLVTRRLQPSRGRALLARVRR